MNDSPQREPIWTELPAAEREVRFNHADRIATTYMELIQKQVESIAKFLLLINAGGAAATLAAMAQRPQLDLKWTLAAFVGGIIVLGFALACSYGLYIASSNANAIQFLRHANGEITWTEYVASLQPATFTGFDRFLFLAATPIYWGSFAGFIVGVVMGAISLWAKH
jgi:predicted phage gp36 major capsid-like protein